MPLNIGYTVHAFVLNLQGVKNIKEPDLVYLVLSIQFFHIII
jgi:hypothetical protein